MAYLQLENLVKSYGARRVVDQFSLNVTKGDFVSVVGPSGCGKTTTLRMIAGFIEPNEGCIRLDGRRIDDVPTHQRDTAMVFQNYALFPHMTVFENVAFGLRMRKTPPAEIERRVGEALALMRLSEFPLRYPKQLSGGQQQRVALARAVVLNPKVLLLDEPLSNLDAKLRKELRSEFLQLHRIANITTIFVTHDLEEAFSLSDQIAVMNNGRIEQIGTPVDIFHHPTTTFVANFVGHSNIFEGRTSPGSAGGGTRIQSGGRSFVLDTPIQAADVRFAVPSHRILVSRTRLDLANVFPAKIAQITFLGSRMQLHLDLGGYILHADLTATKELYELKEQMDVQVGWNADDVVILPSSTRVGNEK